MRQNVIVIVLLLGTVSTAAAQNPTPDDVKRLRPVWVKTTQGGYEIEGRVLDLSAAGLKLWVAGEVRELPLENVLEIQTRGDSLKNGALIGAAIGLLVAWTATSVSDDTFFAATSVGIWTVLGAGVDADPRQVDYLQQDCAEGPPPVLQDPLLNGSLSPFSVFQQFHQDTFAFSPYSPGHRRKT